MKNKMYRAKVKGDSYSPGLLQLGCTESYKAFRERLGWSLFILSFLLLSPSYSPPYERVHPFSGVSIYRPSELWKHLVQYPSTRHSATTLFLSRWVAISFLYSVPYSPAHTVGSVTCLWCVLLPAFSSSPSSTSTRSRSPIIILPIVSFSKVPQPVHLLLLGTPHSGSTPVFLYSRIDVHVRILAYVSARNPFTASPGTPFAHFYFSLSPSVSLSLTLVLWGRAHLTGGFRCTFTRFNSPASNGRGQIIARRVDEFTGLMQYPLPTVVFFSVHSSFFYIVLSISAVPQSRISSPMKILLRF